MYSSALEPSFEIVTKSVRIVGERPKHFYARNTGSAGSPGSARVAAFAALPAVLGEFGIELRDVLDESGLQADIFSDPDNLVPYPVLGHLLAVSARHTNCDYIGLLIGQRSRLATMGLAGQIALCADTAGEGLQRFAEFFTLHNTAATISVISAGGFTRLVYAIAEPEMRHTGQLQLGAMALGFNILQDLCGPGWLPAVVTFASSAPSNLRPCHKFFRVPLRFDSDESSLIFESHWLTRPLPEVDPSKRRQIEAEVLARRAVSLANFPTTIRNILRKQLVIGEFSMDSVAALLGMHRRTLDRKLKQHGMLYGELLDSVKREVACELLRDTHLQIQKVAESLRYSSAANFATAFHRWTGVTPSAYRRKAALVSLPAVLPARPAGPRRTGT
jgi:AraC-like DNA-binding protein